MKKINLILGIFVIFILIALISAGVFIIGGENRQRNTSLEKLTFSGVYTATDGKSGRFLTGMALESSKNQTAVFKGHFNRSLEKNEQLILLTEYTKADIYYDGKQIFSCGGVQNRTSVLNSCGVALTAFNVPQFISASGEVSIALSCGCGNVKTAYSTFFDNIYAGSKYEVLKQNFKLGAPALCISVLFFMCAVLLLVSVLYARIKRKTPMPRSYAAILLIVLLCLDILFDRYCLGLTYELPAVTMFLKTVFLIICSPAALFCLYVYDKSGLRPLIFGVFAGIFELLLYLTLQLSGKVDAYEIRTVIATVNIAFALVGTGICIRCIIKPQCRSRLFFASIMTVFLFTALEAANCYILSGFSVHLGFAAAALGMLLLSAFVTAELRGTVAENTVIPMQETVCRCDDFIITQLKPHFLFNVISAIGELCTFDAGQARATVFDLAAYLRGNMNSISGIKYHSFDEEAAHIKSYLQLEKVLLDDDFTYKFDIDSSDFDVPVKAVEAMFETAVKYGIKTNENGGSLSARAYVEDKGAYIEITSVGRSYDETDKNGDAAFVFAVKSARDKLEKAGGMLVIVKNSDVESSVYIMLPALRQKRR